MTSRAEFRPLVAEIEEATAAAQKRAHARANAVLIERIKPDLGTITVDGFGALVSVELDKRAIRYTNEQALAAAILAAIQQAEHHARER